MTDQPAWTAERRPPPEPEPGMVVLRNKADFPKVIVTEDEAWEIYVALDKLFGGHADAADQPDR